MKKLFLTIGGIIGVFVIAAGIYAATYPRLELVNPQGEAVYQAEDGKIYIEPQSGQLGLAESSFIEYSGEVFGTKTGTSTTYTGFFGKFTASSTDVHKIGGNSEAVYTLSAKASTTPNGTLSLSFFGSNDAFCDTTNTSVSTNEPLISDINWYDIGDHIGGLSGTQTLTGGATTTQSWAGITAYENKTLVLTNLDYECIKSEANGSSTELFMMVRTK